MSHYKYPGQVFVEKICDKVGKCYFDERRGWQNCGYIKNNYRNANIWHLKDICIGPNPGPSKDPLVRTLSPSSGLEREWMKRANLLKRFLKGEGLSGGRKKSKKYKMKGCKSKTFRKCYKYSKKRKSKKHRSKRRR